MERNDPRYQAYVEILKEELIPAMGCTEPIAVAYAAALAARALGCPAEQAEVAASANIIKNVKSVVVPHTGGRRGIAAAAAAGGHGQGHQQRQCQGCKLLYHGVTSCAGNSVPLMLTLFYQIRRKITRADRRFSPLGQKIKVLCHFPTEIAPLAVYNNGKRRDEP